MSASAANNFVPDPAITLVGREREQALLGERLANTSEGQGGLVMIGGGAGIGKTTLAEAICHQALRSGAVVLVGRCYDLAETPPYGPWLEALETIPSLHALLPTLRDPTLAIGGGGQPALFQQIRSALLEIAARQPLVILIDDLQWADPASLDLLGHLGRSSTATPILLLTTYRSDELGTAHPLGQRLPFLVRVARATRLDLQPLDTAAVRAIIVNRYQLSAHDAGRLTAYLNAHAEGNPLYLGELLRTLEEVGTLRATAGDWVVDDLTRVHVPGLLQQIITNRLWHLGKERRETLWTAAVIGQEASLALWLAASGAAEELVEDVVEHATAIGVLDQHQNGLGVRFRHALLREVVYEGIPALRRQRLHRAVSDALLSQSDPDPDAVAYHLRQAGDPRAVEWLVRAGERAQRAYAWLSAVDRYETAHTLLRNNPAAAEERSWLLLRMAMMRRYADPRRSIAHLDEVIGGGIGAVTPSLLAAVHYCRGAIRCLNGDLAGGLPEMVTGVEALDTLPQQEVERLLQHWREKIGEDTLERRQGMLATWLALVGQYKRAQELADTVIKTAPQVINERERLRQSDAYVARLRIAGANGNPSAGFEAYAQADDRYRTAGNFALLYTTIGDVLNRVALPYATEDLAGRSKLAQEADRTYAQATSATADGASSIIRHRLSLIEGRWQELQSIQLDQFSPSDIHLHTAKNVLARLAYEQGQSHHAWKRVHELLPLGPDTAPGRVDFLSALEMQRLGAALAIREGDLQAARSWLTAYDRWRTWGEMTDQPEGALGWAALYRAEGEAVRARQAAETSLELARTPRQPLALLAAARFSGELATAAGRYGEATRQLDAALNLADACAAPYERALTLVAQAELRNALSDHEGAQTLLSEARTICLTLNALPTLEKIATLAKGGAAIRAIGGNRPAGLTGREIEVLRLVAQGLTDIQVADKLSLSPRTISTHLTSIYTKLGVSSRSAATRFMMDSELN